jgi:methylase of polypeptide subunit release factors
VTPVRSAHLVRQDSQQGAEAFPAEVLIRVGGWLASCGYRFVTPTPATHARVLARRRSATSVRDVFGWSLSFDPALLPATIFEAMQKAGLLEAAGDQLRSRIRCSTLDDCLFFHSAYPTTAGNAVFFGPDTYRFVRFIRGAIAGERMHRRIVDIGCGTGAGGLLAARLCDAPSPVVLADINPDALELAAINAHLAGQRARCVRSDVLASVDGEFDLIVANPPYLTDPLHRTYRDGGGELGEALSVRIAREALQRLAPGGRLLLYTGSAIVDGQDRLRAKLDPVLRAARAQYDYREIDPDVFGEELESAAYAEVDRIAAVGLIAQVPR